MSAAFREILQYCFEMGERGSFDDIFPNISRSKFTKQFNEYSKEIRHQQLVNCKGFCSLCIGAGKVTQDSFVI